MARYKLGVLSTKASSNLRSALQSERWTCKEKGQVEWCFTGRGTERGRTIVSWEVRRAGHPAEVRIDKEEAIGFRKEFRHLPEVPLDD